MQISLQGKLKKTIPDKCSDCNINLQIRVIDIKNVSSTRFVENEIIICPRCGRAQTLKPIKKRIKGGSEEED